MRTHSESQFQHANSEATRKILKKHAKRTALPLPEHESHNTDDNLSLILSPRPLSTPLPRILVQAIGEILLPVIPHIDDYSCLICTGVAFKPIRLQCGHLFCVRCLVKMQKRGQGDCPMCRAKTVLVADRCKPLHSAANFLLLTAFASQRRLGAAQLSARLVSRRDQG